MKRVLMLAEHGPGQYSGSAFIRLIHPLAHPVIRADYDVQCGEHLPDESFDIVFTQRIWGPHKTIADARALVRRIRRQARWFVYELDDNLLDLSWDEPWEPLVTAEQRSIVRFFLREADAVMVSTPVLADRVRHLCKRIFLVPNAIDETIFPSVESIQQRIDSRIGSNIVTFGYMGSRTHTLDLMKILEPLRGILRMYRDRVRFEIAEATHDCRIRMALEGLPYTIMAVPSGYFPAFVPWEAENMNWDFGIAPLADSLLNDSKSDLKFIEYGVLGIPGIYSAGASYSPSVEHLRTGLVSAGDAQSWYDAMALMIENGELRRELATNALRHVHSRRTLSKSIGDWRTVLASALDS